jgi:hypothetical protein
MFNTKNLADIYSSYLRIKRNPINVQSAFEAQTMLDIFEYGKKKYKAEILKMFDIAVTDQDVIKLQFCIAAVCRDGIDIDYSDIFHKIILDTWHEEHEDIVDIVFDFKEERFCDALLKIALDQSTYRKFDDENESTLRKCVDALISINTKKSKDIIEYLIQTKNPNVEYTLNMYK